MTKSRNSREGYYIGKRILNAHGGHERTGPKVFPPMEALRFRHKESEQVFDNCSHIQDCPECEGSGFIMLPPDEHKEPCEHCEEGMVWV